MSNVTKICIIHEVKSMVMKYTRVALQEGLGLVHGHKVLSVGLISICWGLEETSCDL